MLTAVVVMGSDPERAPPPLFCVLILLGRTQSCTQHGAVNGEVLELLCVVAVWAILQDFFILLLRQWMIKLKLQLEVRMT